MIGYIKYVSVVEFLCTAEYRSTSIRRFHLNNWGGEEGGGGVTRSGLTDYGVRARERHWFQIVLLSSQNEIKIFTTQSKQLTAHIFFSYKVVLKPNSPNSPTLYVKKKDKGEYL